MWGRWFKLVEWMMVAAGITAATVLSFMLAWLIWQPLVLFFGLFCLVVVADTIVGRGE